MATMRLTITFASPWFAGLVPATAQRNRAGLTELNTVKPNTLRGSDAHTASSGHPGGQPSCGV